MSDRERIGPTPGEWEAVEEDTWLVMTPDGRAIAEVFSGLDSFATAGEQAEAAEANARLMATAKDLLEVLTEIVKKSPFVPTPEGISVSLDFPLIHRTRDVIAKAKGDDA